MVAESSLAEELGLESDGTTKTPKQFRKKPKAEPLTKDQSKALMKKIGYVSNGYRGIKDEFNKFYGHLTRLDNQGHALERLYPETEGGKIVGYKQRFHPKKFSKLGKTGVESDLSGQVRFKKGGGKYLLIVESEEDKVAAYQMFSEYQSSRGQSDYDTMPVVSGTTGAGSLHKQIAAQYDWVDTYDNIILGLDKDEAGLKAIEKCCEVLPAEKVSIATWSGKDPNDMLEKGKEKQFLRDFYNAKPFVSSGIKGSGEILQEVEDFLLVPKLSLPDYMHRLQTNMRGGIGFGRIVNIIAHSSVGKTSVANSLVYHWVMNCFNIAKTGIVSLESTAAEYALDMLSIHLGMNLQSIPEGKEVLKILEDPKIKEKYDTLFTTEDGQQRFHLIDEREGKIQIVEKQIERMVKQFGCKIIIIDVLSDLLRSLDNSQQEKHMMWQKMMVKNGIIIVNVLHTRKPPSDNKVSYSKATEWDALGSSSFVQSAHINIVLNRNKMEEDSVAKNTTEVSMPKCRGGITGHAADWYYDWKTRKMYDSEDYFSNKEDESKPKKI
jgi:archaellum biogenesis ATPase FlaH